MHVFLEGPLALEGVECWLLLSQPGVCARLSPVITLASVCQLCGVAGALALATAGESQP